jgi:predicted DNA-binding transcriptional regulator YafY
VAFSPEVAWWTTKGLQGAEIVGERPDGWVEVAVPNGPGEGLASWVLSFGPDAVVVEPEELRREVVRRLEETVAAR